MAEIMQTIFSNDFSWMKTVDIQNFEVEYVA